MYQIQVEVKLVHVDTGEVGLGITGNSISMERVYYPLITNPKDGERPVIRLAETIDRIMYVASDFYGLATQQENIK